MYRILLLWCNGSLDNVGGSSQRTVQEGEVEVGRQGDDDDGNGRYLYLFWSYDKLAFNTPQGSTYLLLPKFFFLPTYLS